MSQETVNIQPSPRVLRMLGQIDFAPWQCLAELIDNSIDAFIDQEKDGFVIDAPRVSISLPTDRDLATADVSDYIESFYNHVRRHQHLGGVSPQEFETAAMAG